MVQTQTVSELMHQDTIEMVALPRGSLSESDDTPRDRV